MKTLREEISLLIAAQALKAETARVRAKTMEEVGYELSRSHSRAESLTRLEIIEELQSALNRTQGEGGRE